MFYVIDFEGGITMYYESDSYCEVADYADSKVNDCGEYTISEYDSEEQYLNNL